jgi:hypothetical protein
MNIKCEIFIVFDNKKKVENVLKSIKIDDFNFVKSESVGYKLIAHLKSNTILSLLHSLDDYLACITIACSIVDKH